MVGEKFKIRIKTRNKWATLKVNLDSFLSFDNEQIAFSNEQKNYY